MVPLQPVYSCIAKASDKFLISPFKITGISTDSFISFIHSWSIGSFFWLTVRPWTVMNDAPAASICWQRSTLFLKLIITCTF